jgi:hypothetical protein
VAIPVAAVVAVVLVGGQFVVPAIATSVLRHRLSKDGTVLSAHLSAFPWIQLIWQHADKVTASMANYDLQPSQLESLLHQAEGIGTLDMSIGVVHTGLLTLHDVTFTKRGDAMVGDAKLDIADLRAALPIIKSLTPVHNGSGQLVLRGTASVLGMQASVDAVVAARDGKLVVAPTGLLGAFATVTLYDDPQIQVESVTATAVPGGLKFVTTGKVT